ncbi:UNVERIFIED_CONTAM: hypothetical protein GTU68_003721 [Idotea baltica]|nr:hypothetical protein [Idotea baltica]
MVVTAHPEATEVGIKVLKNGGNAIDAMVAVHFALTVCYPRAGNIGGGGFMVYRAANGQKHTLDFRETAPKAASKNMYLNKKGDVIDRLSLDGHLAVGVPGSVDGLWQAHQKFGNLPWAELVFPAIELAEKGYPLTPAEVDYMAEFKEQIKQFNTEENLFTNNTTYKADDQFIQTDLARILKRIGNNGRAGFYEGGVAHMIVEEMKRGNGIITLEDLKNYEAKWREPLIGNYKNEYNIISMPPPSSGGICLLQMLEMLENVPLKEWGFNNEQTIHTINEVEKLAYADRAEHIGDPDFYDVPLEELTDSIYLLNRFNSIDTEQATLSNNVTAGNFGTKSEQTTHYSIVDEERNAVSVTTTLNSHYGSKVLVGGAGFFLNNEMDDFSAKPGVPNQFGLVGKEANAITAGKRMLSSMTPTIVEKNGALFMVLGTPGGSTIITSVLQNIINVVEHDMTMQESVNSLRFHHQWKPDTLYHEPNAFDKALISKLEKRGHTLIEKEKIGRVDAILIRNNKLEGAADTRGEDNALGF